MLNNVDTIGSLTGYQEIIKNDSLIGYYTSSSQDLYSCNNSSGGSGLHIGFYSSIPPVKISTDKAVLTGATEFRYQGTNEANNFYPKVMAIPNNSYFVLSSAGADTASGGTNAGVNTIYYKTASTSWSTGTVGNSSWLHLFMTNGRVYPVVYLYNETIDKFNINKDITVSSGSKRTINKVLSTFARIVTGSTTFTSNIVSISPGINPVLMILYINNAYTIVVWESSYAFNFTSVGTGTAVNINSSGTITITLPSSYTRGILFYKIIGS